MTRQDVRYPTLADVIAIHERAMQEAGQPAAALVREDALQSAIHHPRNLGWYAGADLAEQAVEFMIHVAMAHPFVDGNKRTAVRSTEVFLELNGVSVPTDDAYYQLADLLVGWIASPEAMRPEKQRALIQLVESWMT